MAGKSAKPTEVGTSLGARILARLKGGEEHHVTDFTVKLKNHLEREIRNCETNIKSTEAKYALKIEQANDSLEDRKSELENCVEEVDPEAIKTNEGRRDYIEVYLSNLDRVQEAVDKAEDKVQDLEKEMKAKIDDFNDKIEANKELLKKIQ